MFFFKKLAKFTDNNNIIKPTEPLSILICTKNDLESLKKNIHSWLNQRINQKQVMIVDDFSGIETEQFINSLKDSKECMSYHKVKTNLPGKKQALKEGLSATRYKWTLLTDADCSPKSEDWAALMLGTALQQNKSIVLGYSPYNVTENSWLQLWVHFEAWLTGMLYLSFCLKGIPYMGVGRNLLYDKTIVPSDILSRFNDIASGDDDLLINHISRSYNTTICIKKDSFCYTVPPSSWNGYFKQKLRHYTTSTKYKFKHKLLLALFSISIIIFYLSLIPLLFFSLKIALITYIGFWILVGPVLIKIMHNLEAKFNYFHLFFFHFALCIYYTLFAFTFLFPKRREW